MSLRDLDRRHLQLVSLYSARHAVRGGTGVVFAVVTLFYGLVTAHLLITPVEIGEKSLRGEGANVSRGDLVRELVRITRPAVEWAVSDRSPLEKATTEEARKAQEETRRWAAYLLDDQPALLSAIWLIFIFGLPFLVALGAFNQLSGDVQTRGIRYLLLRTDRSNIFFGRFIATLVFTLVVLAVVVLTIALYVGLKLGIYEGGAVALWTLRGFLALAVIAIPYIALCSWISACVDSPFGSLTLCHVVVGAIPLVAVIGRNSWEPLENIRYVLPWGIQNQLLHPDAAHVAGGALACLGYAVVFLGLGYFQFSRRDL
jgi:hypothetical protein